MIELIDRYFLKKPRVRHVVTKWIEGDHVKDVMVCGFRLCVNTLKEHGYLLASRLQKHSSLLRDEIPVLLSLAYVLPKADAFVDIGSNVGLYSSALAKFQKIGGLKQYAFEANPDTYARLQRTVEGLGVETFNYAVSDQEGELEFIPGAVSHVFTTVTNRSEYSLNAKTIKVPARRLDSFDLIGNRLVLKIDVEGQELNVLRGAEGLFAADRILAVYVDGYQDPGVPEFLTARGFKFHDGRTLEPLDKPGYSLLALKTG